MKAIVFSDSHNSVWLMNELAEKYRSKLNCIIHLGDCTGDTEELHGICPSLPIYQVRGNNDYDSLFPAERVITLGSKRVYMTHGHRHRVYYTTDRIYYSAAEEQADIALFGHTHVPCLENDGGIIVLNPGSISLPRSSVGKTFAFITIENGKTIVSIMGYDKGGIRMVKTLTV